MTFDTKANSHSRSKGYSIFHAHQIYLMQYPIVLEFIILELRKEPSNCGLILSQKWRMNDRSIEYPPICQKSQETCKSNKEYKVWTHKKHPAEKHPQNQNQNLHWPIFLTKILTSPPKNVPPKASPCCGPPLFGTCSSFGGGRIRKCSLLLRSHVGRRTRTLERLDV